MRTPVMKLHTACAGLLLCLPLLACSRQAPAPNAHDSAQKGFLATKVDQAFDKARKEMREGNLSLNDSVDITVGDRHLRKPGTHAAKAAISPTGDLLIEGKAVAITPQQRQQLLTYRQQVFAIAESGMVIGSKGVGLAGEALKGVGSAIFGSDADKQAFDQHMQAQGKKLEADARQLCTLLPPMLASQQALAASLPAFKPYATMTQDDIDDCTKGASDRGVAVMSSADTASEPSQPDAASDSMRDTIRNDIRNNIRSAVQASVQGMTTPDKHQCAFKRAIALTLNTAGARTVQFRTGSDDLQAEATAGGSGVTGVACASSQAALDAMTIEQARQGDKLVVSVKHADGNGGTTNINVGPIQMHRYAFMQLHAQVPDMVTVQVVAGSGDVAIHNAKRASLDLGSGDARLQGIRGDTYVSVGSGDLLVDGAGSLRVLNIGSGDADVRNVRGTVAVDSVGSGDLTIDHAGRSHIGSVGSGDVTLTDIAGDVHVEAVGSGDVVARGVAGDLTVDAMGSGDVRHSGVTGKLNLPRGSD